MLPLGHSNFAAKGPSFLAPTSYYAFSSGSETVDSAGSSTLTYVPATGGGGEFQSETGINGEGVSLLTVTPYPPSGETNGYWTNTLVLASIGDWAISAWFRPDTCDATWKAANQGAMTISRPVGGYGATFNYWRKSAVDDWAFQVRAASKSYTTRSDFDVAPLSAGWHHFFAVLDNSFLPRVWLDGVESGTWDGRPISYVGAHTGQQIGASNSEAGIHRDETAYFADVSGQDFEALAQYIYNSGTGRFWDGSQWA